MLVQNYGLYWKRENIFWGRPRNAGHLKGIPSSNITTTPIDFRLQQGIYVLYDDNFSLIYVGQVGSGNNRLFKRLKQHSKKKLAERWSKFSWFGVRKVLQTGNLAKENLAAHSPLSDVLNHLEAVLIEAAEPPLNRQGGSFGDGVDEYLQYRDTENLGPDTQTMIREIHLANQHVKDKQPYDL